MRKSRLEMNRYTSNGMLKWGKIKTAQHYVRQGFNPRRKIHRQCTGRESHQVLDH